MGDHGKQVMRNPTFDVDEVRLDPVQDRRTNSPKGFSVDSRGSSPSSRSVHSVDSKGSSLSSHSVSSLASSSPPRRNQGYSPPVVVNMPDYAPNGRAYQSAPSQEAIASRTEGYATLSVLFALVSAITIALLVEYQAPGDTDPIVTSTFSYILFSLSFTGAVITLTASITYAYVLYGATRLRTTPLIVDRFLGYTAAMRAKLHSATTFAIPMTVMALGLHTAVSFENMIAQAVVAALAFFAMIVAILLQRSVKNAYAKATLGPLSASIYPTQSGPQAFVTTQDDLVAGQRFVSQAPQNFVTDAYGAAPTPFVTQAPQPFVSEAIPAPAPAPAPRFLSQAPRAFVTDAQDYAAPSPFVSQAPQPFVTEAEGPKNFVTEAYHAVPSPFITQS
eukprot:m.10371 g.10371  ORF g.10371 m.10371 type:complete len:390 (+) comp5555_c0_seq1:165-1334(+)